LPLSINVGWQSVHDQSDGNALLLTEEDVEFHAVVVLAKTVNVLNQLDRLDCVNREVDIDIEAVRLRKYAPTDTR
jgi:hypothetical protein